MADISEREAFASLLDSLLRARDSMRAIALLRSDERWIEASQIFDRVKDNATRLMHRKPPVKTGTRLWLPNQQN